MQENTMQAMNPFLPLYEYVPDGEPRIFGDRLYLYGSHDQAGGTQFCENDYVVWSAPLDNLADWRYEGVSYTVDQNAPDPDAAGNLAAPDCVQGPDGRFYLYYNRGARMACEVAVSDVPQGPFTYLGNVAFPDGTEPKAKMFDPGVLVDDDGRIYLYTGFVPTPGSPWINVAGRFSLVCELETDMRTIKAGPVELMPGCLAAKGTEYEDKGFYEASSPRKIGDKYYLIYSSEKSHDLSYAVSDKPMEGFRYGGVLVSNADLGYEGNTRPRTPYGNTHGGLVQIGQDWYVFYHRQTHGIECCRQACAEKLVLKEDGLFAQAEMTSCGLNGGPLEGLGTYAAAYACNLIHESILEHARLSIRACVRDTQPHIYQEMVDEDETHALVYIANMQNGTVAGFKYFGLGQAGTITIKARSTGDARIKVYLDEACTREAADIAVKKSDRWEVFQAPFTAPMGTYPLFFRLEGECVMDWLEFTLL